MKRKYNLSYEDYWNNRGEYGKERIKRFLLRKEKRKKSLLCNCGNNPKESPHTCPYAEDMYGDSETTCRCCDDCIKSCLGDI